MMVGLRYIFINRSFLNNIYDEPKKGNIICFEMSSLFAIESSFVLRHSKDSDISKLNLSGPFAQTLGKGTGIEG